MKNKAKLGNSVLWVLNVAHKKKSENKDYLYKLEFDNEDIIMLLPT